MSLTSDFPSCTLDSANTVAGPSGELSWVRCDIVLDVAGESAPAHNCIRCEPHVHMQAETASA